MKTILVIAQQPGLAEAVRTVVDSQRYRVVHQVDVGDAEMLRTYLRVDVCVLDADLVDIRPIRIIEAIRRALPQCPILLFAGARQWEWEEEAYLLGVEHVLSKPIRGRLFNSILDRFWYGAGAGVSSGHDTAQLTRVPPLPANLDLPPVEPARAASQTLEVLRDVSAVLSHSLSADPLIKQFLLQLREIVGVNRAAVFLRPPPDALNQSPEAGEARRLRSMCAIGLPAGLLEHFALSLDAGVGGYVSRQGRILRRNASVVQQDAEMSKEFELLGVEVALPILDRETVMGVAFFDNRITGDPLSSEELALIFYLLESLGMAVRNIWLHDQLAANNSMMSDILRQINSACVVVGRNLTVLHANQMARDFFTPASRRGGQFEFSDLPQTLGSKVFEVLRTGIGLDPFKYQSAPGSEKIYQVTVSPFLKQNRGVPDAALLMVEDYTQADRLHRLEIETANLRTIKLMAERLAHEIGNAVVPLATHQQLFARKIDDPEFRASLDSALLESTQRITRLGSQMLYLAQDPVPSAEPIPVSQLIKDAFREAQKHHPEQSVCLQHETGEQALKLSGNKAGLRHALAEVMLNALQANPPSPRIKVSTRSETDPEGHPWVHIEVQDAGTGFTPEAARKVGEPFFTTRNVGLGLGLTVSRKIIESHHGKLEVASPRTGQSGMVTISLPVTSN